MMKLNAGTYEAKRNTDWWDQYVDFIEEKRV